MDTPPGDRKGIRKERTLYLTLRGVRLNGKAKEPYNK
jgi:hypothetical protein